MLKFSRLSLSRFNAVQRPNGISRHFSAEVKLTVADLLSTRERYQNAVRSVPMAAPVIEAVKVICDGAVGTVLVTDEQKHVRGIISEKDYTEKLTHGSFAPADINAGQIMHPILDALTPDTRLTSALQSLITGGRRFAPVLTPAAASFYQSLTSTGANATGEQRQEADTFAATLAEPRPTALPCGSVPLSAFGALVSLRDLTGCIAEAVYAAQKDRGASDESLQVGIDRTTSSDALASGSKASADGTVLSWNARVDDVLLAMKAAGRRILLNTRLDDNITVMDASNVMAEKGISCVAVVDDANQLQGIFTSRDLLTRVILTGQNAARIRVRDIMTRDVYTVPPERSVLKSIRSMIRRGIRHLPIVEPETGKVLGIVTAADLSKCLVGSPITRKRVLAQEVLTDALETQKVLRSVVY